MLIGFNFLVFKCRDEDLEPVLAAMTKLGFTCCNIHKNQQVTFWYQNKCLIQIQISNETKFAGFGLITHDTSLIEKLKLPKDMLTGWHLAVDPNGIEFYILDAMGTEKNIIKSFELLNPVKEESTDLTRPAGMVLNFPVTPEVSKFYRSLGFKKSKNGNLTRFTPPDNAFTLSIGEKDIDNKYLLYVDCNDIFSAISKLAVAGFDQVPSTQKLGEFDIGPKNNRLSISYQASAFGNKASFSIEKVVRNPLPGMDMIIRERHQKLHITEKNIDFLYAVKG